MAYELFVEDIKKGNEVLHSCDTPACVRPSHLWQGTQKDNIQDSISKGRHRYIAHPGSKNGMATLTESEVIQIRKEWEEGLATFDELRERFNIGRSGLYFILERRSWRHI